MQTEPIPPGGQPPCGPFIRGFLGLLAVVCFTVLKHTWDALEMRDPALAPPLALPPAAGAAAYEAWPAAALLAVRALYFAAHALTLMRHLLFWNWCSAIGWPLPLMAVAAVAGTQLRSPRAQATVIAACFSLWELVLPVGYASCISDSVAGALLTCDAYVHATRAHCPPCSQASNAMSVRAPRVPATAANLQLLTAS
jgi:hypothetical protein